MIGLVERATRDHEEALAVRSVCATGRLGDVRADRVDRTDELDADCPSVNRVPAANGLTYLTTEPNRSLIGSKALERALSHSRERVREQKLAPL